MKTKETVLYFGSFNPIHTGHLLIAHSVLDIEQVGEVWFVVSPQSPFKKSQQLLAENNRYYLAQLATEDNSRFKVSNIEFKMPKPSYTIDTLLYLKEKYPKRRFSLLMGSDNLIHIHKWKNHDLILNEHKIYCYSRENSEVTKDFAGTIIALDCPKIDLSSTLIRQRIAEKKSIRYLVPDATRLEIEKSGYYL
jgi:nicotinate-nucleotide adenylyltransferase